MPDHRDALRNVRTFPQLIKFLRNELEWPIESESFEDLTFDYTPEELGIDTASAAKIQEIKRLRPLSAGQPWGIFFVKFEPKQLPVVALRRILSRVVLKKRASANSADRAAWHANDLLFISNYGKGEERQISFAHFSQDLDKDDLPTLKVLGWDNLDTPLHLDAVAAKLTTNLAWPEDDTDIEAWRASWRSAFELRHREVVTTSHELSIRLAELARAIRDRINTALAHETERGPLTKLMKAFQESLVHDLDAAGFADMYAQTIAYGLFSARIADPHKKTVDDFAAHMRTNPFLKELMQTFLHVGGRRGKAGGLGIDFDELGVSEVVELLDDANMEAVVRDFGDKNSQEDPVTHFYEGFAKQYDPIDKVRRGEFYTPRPVVSYIVRSVDELLRTEFDLADGLADITTWAEMAKRHKGLKIPDGVDLGQAFIQILDPATGTGTFLVEVIDLIHKTLVTKWKAHGHSEKKIESLWNEYVPHYLLPRLYAYELKMAPYAIAHLKIGLKLYETGYRFGSEERARIYLTNALEPASDVGQQTLEGFLPALAHEVDAVNKVKRERRFTVVVGNPPYSISSANSGAWIQQLVSAYKVGLNEVNVNSLSDDYVKFLRFVQYLLSEASAGIVGMITNNSYLDGTIHREMRASLLRSYSKIFVCDLHGSAKVPPKAGFNKRDKNVFDIQQGVAVALLVQAPTATSSSVVMHHDCYGEREFKYKVLMDNTVRSLHHERVPASPPNYFLKPKDFTLVEEYQRGWPVGEMFRIVSTGVKFRKDNLLVRNNFSSSDAVQMLKDVRNLSREKLFEKYDFAETDDWKLSEKKHLFKPEQVSDIRCIAYRPFDRRFAYYPLDKISEIIVRGDSRVGTAKHLLLTPNIALIVKRSRMINVDYFCHICVVKCLPDLNYLGDQSYFAPLYSVISDGEGILKFAGDKGGNERHRVHNISVKLVNRLVDSYGLTFRDDGVGDLHATFGPEDILHYAYSVLHSPDYRSRYAEFLKIDFPRLPLTRSLKLFQKLARLGGQLIALHLLESPKLDQHITEFNGGRNSEVEKVSWSKNTVWVDKAQTIGFCGVPENVWNFHIGGYQVCEKWLKDRGPKKGEPGRALTKDDVTHYQRIVVALNETIRLMKEIDEVIEKHGGWPAAFSTPSDKTATTDGG